MVPDSVHRLIDENGIEFFLCSFVEISGAPKAKLVPATHVEDMASEGAGFAGFAAGDINQMPHDPDIMSVPDFSSTTVLPWARPERMKPVTRSYWSRDTSGPICVSSSKPSPSFVSRAISATRSTSSLRTAGPANRRRTAFCRLQHRERESRSRRSRAATRA